MFSMSLVSCLVKLRKLKPKPRMTAVLRSLQLLPSHSLQSDPSDRQQHESDSVGHDDQLISPITSSLFLPCWELLECSVTWARLLMIELINQINQVLCLCTFTFHWLLFGHFSACKYISKAAIATSPELLIC